MQMGMIGLGRMGANMVRRLMRGGHTCVVLRRRGRWQLLLSRRFETSKPARLGQGPPRRLWNARRFATLAPGAGTSAKTTGSEGRNPTAEQGKLQCGPNGAGHVVKNEHNGIQYGRMGDYARG